MLTAQQQRDAWRLGLLADAGCGTISDMRRADPALSWRGARALLKRAEREGWAIPTRSGWVLCPPRVEREPCCAFAAALAVVEQMRPGQVFSTTQLVQRARLRADWGHRWLADQLSTLVEFGYLQQVEFGYLQQVERLPSNERQWMRCYPCASAANR